MTGVQSVLPSECRRAIAVADGVAPRRRRPLPMQYKHSPAAFRERLVPRNGGCRDWPGPFQTRGLPYGKTNYRGRTVLTHRLAWLFAYGPIPEGLEVCHTCDRPQCCESSHLFLGTQADNIRDREAKGRTAKGARSGARTRPDVRPRGERQWQTRLTEEAVISIREQWAAGGATLRSLGQAHGVSLQAVWRIVHGETWRHLLTTPREEPA